MVKRRVGDVTIEGGGDWLRMRYRRGTVFEELYMDEDGRIEAVRRTRGGESQDIPQITTRLPMVLRTLAREEGLAKFSGVVRAYFDERNPPVVKPIMPSMSEGTIYHEPAGRDGRVFFFRKGNVYEEVEIRLNGEIRPMQLTYLRDRVLRLPKTLEMIGALDEFSTSMDINPALRPYTEIVKQYCRQQLQ